MYQTLKLILCFGVIAGRSETFHSELQLARRRDVGSNHSGCARAIVDESIGLCDRVLESFALMRRAARRDESTLRFLLVMGRHRRTEFTDPNY
jgi:hypothetical protein